MVFLYFTDDVLLFLCKKMIFEQLNKESIFKLHPVNIACIDAFNAYVFLEPYLVNNFSI